MPKLSLDRGDFHKGLSLRLPLAILTLVLLFLPAAHALSSGPSIEAVLNAASYERPVAPGGIVTLFGSDLAASAAFSNALPLPTNLGGVQVTFDGVVAPIYSVSPTFIQVQAPLEIAARIVAVQVERDGMASTPFTVEIADAAPGIFSVNGKGTGQGLIYVNGQLADFNSGAAFGDVVVIYATGLGATDPAGRCVSPASVVIAGREAEVLYAGLTGGFVGLYQVNVILPGVGVDQEQPVRIVADGRSSNTVTMATR